MFSTSLWLLIRDIVLIYFFSLWESLDEKLLQFMKALFVLLMTQKLEMLLCCDY